ncbi:MAG: 50S ribosomal protein L18Ae [Thermoplasmata archaeon]
MKIYRVIGNYRQGKKLIRITKEIAAKNKQEAEEYFYSFLGSVYGKNRREINIEDAYSIPLKEATDPRARYKINKLGGEHGE